MVSALQKSPSSGTNRHRSPSLQYDVTSAMQGTMTISYSEGYALSSSFYNLLFRTGYVPGAGTNSLQTPTACKHQHIHDHVRQVLWLCKFYGWEAEGLSYDMGSGPSRSVVRSRWENANHSSGTQVCCAWLTGPWGSLPSHCDVLLPHALKQRKFIQLHSGVRAGFPEGIILEVCTSMSGRQVFWAEGRTCAKVQRH